jgi:para-aminobenzoate synthetase
MLTRSARCFAVRYGLVPKAVDTRALFDVLFAASETSFWLDGGPVGTEPSRFTFLGDDRGPLNETLSYRLGAAAVTVRDLDTVRFEPGSIFEVLDARLAQRRIGPTALPFDFVGGYLGHFGPAPAGIRNAIAASDAIADSVWTFADRIVAVDHQADLTYVLAVEDGRWQIRAAVDAWISDTMRRVGSLPRPSPGAAISHSALGRNGRVIPDGDRYTTRIERRRSQLASGESCRTALIYPVAFGYFGLAGAVDLNIVVRTLVPAEVSIGTIVSSTRETEMLGAGHSAW